jgi:shikimate kinase
MESAFDFVFIYGPPAAGKLTVAQEVSRMTGYRVFDNHASLDFVTTIFDLGTEECSEMVVKARMMMLEAAAKKGVSVIFTSAYVKGPKVEATMKMLEMIHNNGGRVHLVNLHCDREELLRRVGGESRRRHGKFTDPAQLDEFLRNYEEPVIRGSFRIDNTNKGPREVAEEIVRHYSLRRADGRQIYLDSGAPKRGVRC